MLKKLGLIATLSLLACQAQAGEHEDLAADRLACRTEVLLHFGGVRPAATDTRYDEYLVRNNDCLLARGEIRKNANNPDSSWIKPAVIERWIRSNGSNPPSYP